MTLYELGKYLKPDEPINYKSVLRSSLRVCDVTDGMMERCDSTVYLMGENGAPCGKMSREVLNFLRSAQQRSTFVEILDHISEGVIAVDERGRIYYLNHSYAQILGVKPYKVIGRYIQNVEPGSLLSKVVSTHREVFSGKKRVASVNKYISVHIFPVFSGSKFAGAFSIFQDATEVYNLREKLEWMKDLIREMQNSKPPEHSTGLRLLSPVTDGTLEDMMRQCEKQLLLQVLAEEQDNRTQAMERLGLSRRTFYRKCAEYNLKKAQMTEDAP
jgi:PAS domain S-box-containing protein